MTIKPTTHSPGPVGMWWENCGLAGTNKDLFILYVCLLRDGWKVSSIQRGGRYYTVWVVSQLGPIDVYRASLMGESRCLVLRVGGPNYE